MKKLSFLLFCLMLLATACQKTQEPRDATPEAPVIFEQSAHCEPINCDHCHHALIDPSCCCIITVRRAEVGKACLELCGTSSPLVPDDCWQRCEIEPHPDCPFPIGPVYERIPGMVPGQSHIYCAGIGYSYRVASCTDGEAEVAIRCGRDGRWGPPVVMTLSASAPFYMTVDEDCNARLCP